MMMTFVVLTASLLTKTFGRPAATTSVCKEHGNILIGITVNNENWIDVPQVKSHAVRATLIRLQTEHAVGAVVVLAGKDLRSGLLVQAADQKRMVEFADVFIRAGDEYH